MTKVIVYRKEILRNSETFIKAQVQSYRRWQAVLFGERLWPGGLSLDGVTSRTLLQPHPGKFSRVFAKARQLAEIVPPSVIRKFESEQASIFHTHFGGDGILSWPYARKLKIPMVVTLHGSDISILPSSYRAGSQGFQARRYPENFSRFVSRANVHFIAVSHALRRSAIDVYGVPESRIFTRYTGIDVEQFAPGPRPVPERPRRILFIGRMVEKKGTIYLLDAFRTIRQSLPDAELVMVGAGPLLEETERTAKEWRLPVEFTGNLPHEQIRRHLELARVFCLPSVTASNGDAEGLPTVLLEAQACGVPVVTSALGGKEGVVDGVTGFIFPEKDVKALADRLGDLLGNDDLAARMSAAGPEHVRRNFDILKCTSLIEAYYDEILSKQSDKERRI
jgi:glycosyltransferase involved in cell wall biosynthesis